MAETYLNMVNRLLLLLGETPYADATQFNSTDLSDHQKIQIQAKEWFGLNHQTAMVVPRARFLLRDYTFNTVIGTKTYNLNAATNYERLLEDSMFITTAGSEYGPLLEIDFLQYRREFPNNNEANGSPTRYYHTLRSAADGPDQIGLSSPPSAVVAVQYSAFLKPYRLTQATDQICVDDEWEHIFLFGTTVFVEIMKSEGKAPDFAGFAEKLKDEFEQHTIPTAGEHMRLDPTCGDVINIWGRRGQADTWSSW